MKIDFVSDVACPWCAVGLNSLEIALQRIGDEIAVDVHFQPFELNPDMPAAGEDIIEHLSRKYGASADQLAASRQALKERGAAVGFSFGDRGRVWNTFDAHRLLYWAGLQGRQRELKHALLEACHGRGENPGDEDVLVRCAVRAGLDAVETRDVIQTGHYADEVRAAETFFQRAGIRSVPAIIINEKHLISGGQPPEVFEQALRQIATEPPAESAGA